MLGRDFLDCVRSELRMRRGEDLRLREYRERGERWRAGRFRWLRCRVVGVLKWRIGRTLGGRGWILKFVRRELSLLGVFVGL